MKTARKYYGKPVTITDFRKIPAKLRGKKAEVAKKLHDKREADNKQLKKSQSYGGIIAWIRDRKVFPRGLTLIPLGKLPYHDCGFMTGHGKKKNWETAEETFRKSFVHSRSHGRYSSRCSFERFSYSPLVESWGKLISSKHIYVRIDTENGIFSKVIKSPRGWSWGKDNNGIFLKMGKLDYHPTAQDLVNGVDLRKTAKENYRIRREGEKEIGRKARQEKSIIVEARQLGVWVSIADAANAGNCQAGINQFANRFGLTGKYVEANKLSKLESGSDRGRVMLSILSAVRRHKSDMERGYCLI